MCSLIIVHNLNVKFEANKWEEDAGSLPPPWLLRPHQCLLHPGHFNVVDTSECMSNFDLSVNRFSALRQCLVSFPKTLWPGVGISPTAPTSSGCWTWSPGILGASRQPRSGTSVLRNCHWSSWWPNSRAIWKSFRFYLITASEDTIEHFRSSMEMSSWMSSCQPSSLLVSVLRSTLFSETDICRGNVPEPVVSGEGWGAGENWEELGERRAGESFPGMNTRQGGPSRRIFCLKIKSN